MSSSSRLVRGLSPGRPVSGVLRPPASKSAAQRVLLAALLAEGTSRLRGLGTVRAEGAEDENTRGTTSASGEVDLPAACDDVRAALGVVRALGARVRAEGEELVVTGTGGRPVAAPIRVGESGTLARIATAIVAWCADGGTPEQPERPERDVTIEADGSLRSRRSPALLEALSASGVRIGFPQGQERRGDWPLHVVPRAPRERSLRIAQPGSSQEVSALLFCAAGRLTRDAQDEAHWRVRSKGPLPSRPYVGLTLDVLERFRVTAAAHEGVDDFRWQLVGRLQAPRERLEVEADASAAAVALAAGVLSGGRVAIEGIPATSAQGDARILEHLCAFGCDARREADQLVATGAPVRRAVLDLEREPDLAPVLAVVAAAAARTSGARSRLTGLGTLRGKESDRIAVLAAGLEACGYAVQASDDALEIGPGAQPGTYKQGRGDAMGASGSGEAARALALDPHGDHRMAFAFALLGLLHDGVRVRDPDCVSKSWPGFWDDLEALSGSS